jgi:hypothetical protein
MPGVRTPQKVFQHHAESLAAADVGGIAADYADDSILITPGGVVGQSGHPGGVPATPR